MSTVEEQVGISLLEQTLWSEMLSRWKQILKAVAANRVLPDRGFEIFKEAFRDRFYALQECKGNREIDARLMMLWGLVQEDRASFVEPYFQWIKNNSLKELFDGIGAAQIQIIELKRRLETLQNSLTTLSWWDSIWKRSELEVQIDDVSQQIKNWKNTLISLAPQMRSELDKWSCGGVIQLPQKFWTIECVDEMVYIPAGAFTMGALEDDRDAYVSERPRHMVTLTQGFWMGKYPVTQALWEGVKGVNRSVFKGSNRPVENISWFDVVKFCNQLSLYEGLDPAYQIDGTEVICDWKANGYRLPTEAEWEYCARAGQDFKFFGSNTLRSVAWYADTSLGHDPSSRGEETELFWTIRYDR